MKKRQKDFEKVSLKVGRTLPRKRNETNTTIKKRKLQMPTQKLVKKTAVSFEDFVKSVCHGSARDEDLKRLKNLLKQEKDFSQFLPEILNKMTKIILDNNLTKSLRDNALKVIVTVLELTDDSKLSPFISLFINVISCAITNSNEEIKSISMELIDNLLKTHPSLICCSVTTFTDLLTFLSGQIKKAPATRTRQTDNTVTDAASAKLVKILDCLNMFLDVLLEKENSKDENKENEVEIYWDCKKPLHLELYAGGGLKPFDLEKYYSSSLHLRDDDFKDPVKIKELVELIMPLCSEIFIEFSEDCSGATDGLLSNDTVKKFGILFDFLSKFGEWVKLLSNSESTKDFAEAFSKVMLKHIMKFPFNPREASINLKKQERRIPSVQLNLAICYLYSSFILGTEYCTGLLKDPVFDYLVSVQSMPNEIRLAVIPVMLKITKNYFRQEEIIVTEYVDKVLFGLCNLFGTEKVLPNQKLLASFLTKVSLQPEYNAIMESKAMKTWLNNLAIYFVKLAAAGSVDKSLLNDIKRIANCKHRYFLESIEVVRIRDMIGLYRNADEDLQDTLNFLMCSMEFISPEYYEQLTDLILSSSDRFPTRSAVRLIHLLTYKFNKDTVRAEDRVNYIQFLLNLAVDVCQMQDSNFVSSCPQMYLDSWDLCDNYFKFGLIPTLEWKNHSALFEVCLKSLSVFPQPTVCRSILEFLTEVTRECQTLPVHSAISMIRLYLELYPEKTTDKRERNQHYFRNLMDELIYCSLVFISVFTTLPFEDDWYYNNVTALMGSFDIPRSVAVKCVERMCRDSLNISDGIVGYYLLRFIKFLINRNLLQEDDRNKILKILENFKINCENLEQQTLFIQLVNIFGGYYR